MTRFENRASPLFGYRSKLGRKESFSPLFFISRRAETRPRSRVSGPDEKERKGAVAWELFGERVQTNEFTLARYRAAPSSSVLLFLRV